MNRIFRIVHKLPMRVGLSVMFRIDPVRTSRYMGVRIGKDCRIYGCDPQMWGTEPFLVRIGDNVFITDGCRFITHDGGTLILRRDVPDLEITAPIIIGNDVYLGIRSIILPGVTIGNRVIVGAGSIVTKDIPDNSVAAGSPARVIKTVDDYLKRAKERSLHLGHLSAWEKESALRKKYFPFSRG